MRTVFVDYNRIGSSISFRVPLSRQERDGVQVGDTITLTGDPDMPDQRAAVVELTSDGYAVLQLVPSSRRAAAG
jgi:hypothetical protein